MDLSIAKLQAAYRQEHLTPSGVIHEIYGKLGTGNIFVCLTPLEDLLHRCRQLEEQEPYRRGALYGVPFAVKDNIDALPLPTTAACEAYKFTPSASAPCVQALIEAGAIMVGKTNMDQFATGLVGTRTPYGVAKNAFDSRFIPGGSSSGSGAALGAGLVTFALGTDTAGSGRIPAGMNGCVGVKPTVGRVSTSGVVPACRSLDCVTVFAQSVDDGAAVVKLMQAGGLQLADPNWRPPPQPAAPLPSRQSFRFAVPGPEFLDFSGPGGLLVKAKYEALFAEAIQRLLSLGGQQVSIDFSPFAQTARLLYESAFVAERYSGIRQFLESGPTPPTVESVTSDPRLEKVIGAIIGGAGNFVAADVYDGLATLNVLRGRARVEMHKFDVLLVPTTLHHYTIEEIAEQEVHAEKVSWGRNANLGRFTNFANLLDLCGLAVPSGLLRHEAREPDSNHATAEERRRWQQLKASGDLSVVLPFGVTFLARAWQDEFLWDLAAAFHKQSGLGSGPVGHGVAPK
ncbi:hypothetical protein WJX72_002684 [[Myrmecia] bisecta]|uniref:Amidase domain-containing protein n=1 Tax=[Myrmecia] bisecta TaxID=41462 RepID=A0AAW1QEI4_9CHLO